ncbi:hypothetical protein BN7_295 [Wickerhamomyces ciferrii]|uniref:Trafficking protein particle complex subunit 11 domain-containing protein n=1 Tax=Wickerhamomyces ciferrii (strain ATCC 14091 / BCRC 22168 / CBS 111 / JCM 3599 / NBRC 0793 / NRRL Y-1031 F-60-10) TaxID=1206466 RepID=K0KD13_WICCF|nr:uncharacterized protein BN7_295 [Wickerhamomyces ciferrii]CCH40761.1 hypothetical protein BN7_295 [Wickerhamomyces ciferrii]
MESYDTEYTAHLSPLVLVQGIGQGFDGGESNAGDGNDAGINGELLFRKQDQLKRSPAVKGLVSSWRRLHNEDLIWDSTAINSDLLQSDSSTSSSSITDKFHFKIVDKHYIPKVKDLDDSNTHFQLPQLVLTSQWIQKYKSILPSTVVSFYELNHNYTDLKEIEKIDLELISEINMLQTQLQHRHIKPLIILVSSSSSNVEMGINERISIIRKQTGLNNKNCLLLLESSTPKETNEVFQNSIQFIKISNLEFFNQLEKKFKKKRSTFLNYSKDEFSKNIIEARYSLKNGFINEFKKQYPQAIKNFQFSYEFLLKTLNTISSKENSEIYIQYRILLDITMFHIIRLFFYQGQFNQAYKKFDLHLQSIIYQIKLQKFKINSFKVCNWISSQFKILAQLSDLVTPNNLVPIDQPFLSNEKDPHSPLVLPQSGYLYLQAFNLLKNGGKYGESEDDDPYPVIIEHDKTSEYINLLNFSKLSFQKKDNSFLRSISFINFQIAEEYFANKEYESSLKFYEISLDAIKDFNNWGFISSKIYYKLLICFLELGKHYAFIINLIEISLFDNQIQQLNNINDIKELINNEEKLPKMLQNVNEDNLLINLSTDETFDILVGKVCFHEKIITLSNELAFQIEIQSNLNEILGVVKFNELLVTFQGNNLNEILIKHDDSIKSNSVSYLKSNDKTDDNIPIFYTNLEFNPFEKKVFQFKLPTRKIGVNSCISISSILDYNKLFQIKLNIPLKNYNNDNINNLNSLHKWYHQGKSLNNYKIISNLNPETYEVIPRIPKTKINIGDIDDDEFGIVGEVFKIPVKILNNDHESIDLEMEISAKIGDEEIEIKWDDQGDGQLKLEDVEVDKEILKNINLKIPNFFTMENSIILIKLSYTFYVSKDYEVPIIKHLTKKIKIIDPFKISISFLPRLLNESLPNPFIINSDDQAIPKPSRFWLASLIISNTLPLDLELIDETIVFKTTDDDMMINEFKDKLVTSRENDENQDKLISNHYIGTSIIKDGTNYRNINFNSNLVVRYKRLNSDTVLQTFKNKIWKFSLPLLDPRVLLDVERPTNEDNNIKLIFMIENPTSRIFQFQLTLTDNSNFQITSGVKTQNVSILPITRQKFEFNLIPMNNGLLSLPQLTVYDLNYRVNLPTLLVSDEVQLKNKEIYINIE